MDQGVSEILVSSVAKNDPSVVKGCCGVGSDEDVPVFLDKVSYRLCAWSKSGDQEKDVHVLAGVCCYRWF